MENKEGRWHLGYPSPRCPSAVLPLSLAPAASGHLGAMRGAGTYCGRQARRVPPAVLSARGGAPHSRWPRRWRKQLRRALLPARCRALFIQGSTSLEDHVTRSPRDFLLNI